MATLTNPILFSTRYGLSTQTLANADLLDPVLNTDTKVFIDPVLIKTSTNSVISTDAFAGLQKHFSNIIQLLLGMKVEGDPAWKAALRLLNLDECRETCLGYGSASVRGSGRPSTVRNTILRTTKQILDIGVSNPEIISLMGFLDEGVGPDTIGDLATNSIVEYLAQITKDFCVQHQVPLAAIEVNGRKFDLPLNDQVKPTCGILLVPRDILRDLPIAADWADVERAAFQNQQIRDRVSELVAGIATATITQKKHALKEAVLQSAAEFLDVFEALLNTPERHYDPKRDKNGIYRFREVLESVSQAYPRKIQPPTSPIESELDRVVGEILDQFKQLIENNGLNELLWYGDTPRSEKAAQLLFFAVADSYCRTNNIDISPETHSGGGPVDFKFSIGYLGRVLVELKLSNGKVVSGYNKQLDVYKSAAQTTKGVLLIVDVGGMGKKLKTIQQSRTDRLTAGQPASDIRVVSALRQASASKR
jgi:hypothetical protein